MNELRPGDLVGLNKDSYLTLSKLPTEFDSRVQAMEVDERPTDQYADIGGCDKQIQEMMEAVVLPMTHKERFDKIGIKAPKGCLLYGPPGTGKTMMARACAAGSPSPPYHPIFPRFSDQGHVSQARRPPARADVHW